MFGDNHPCRCREHLNCPVLLWGSSIDLEYQKQDTVLLMRIHHKNQIGIFDVVPIV